VRNASSADAAKTGPASLVADLVDHATSSAAALPAAVGKPAHSKNQTISLTPLPVGRASPRESRLKWSWSFHSKVERGGMSVLTRSDVWAGELRSVRPLGQERLVSFPKGCESRTLEQEQLAQLEMCPGGRGADPGRSGRAPSLHRARCRVWR
jgi:hypothetical protein